MSFRPERCFVITLPRRQDRRRYVDALSATLPGLQTVDGVDGRVPADRGSWRASGGAWGNRESHLRLLERCTGADSVLMLEDDAVLTADFLAELDRLVARVPENWEVLMLGGQHLRTPLRVDRQTVRCVRTVRTHAYLVNGLAIPLVAEVARNAQTHWDHALARTLGARGRTYAPDPFLVGAARTPSDIPDSTPLRPSFRVA